MKKLTLLFARIEDMCSRGYNKLCIVTVDTDVVVIALHAFHFPSLYELWIDQYLWS